MEIWGVSLIKFDLVHGYFFWCFSALEVAVLLQQNLLFLWAKGAWIWFSLIEDRRKKVFWNIEDGIYLFFDVFCFGGKKFSWFLEKEVGYNEQDIYIWNIHNSTALTALTFLGINRILLLWFMSLLACIPSSSPSFLAFLLEFGIEIQVF